MYKETELICKSRVYTTELLNTLPEGYHYHNLEHTRDVVEAAADLCSKENLTPKETELVIIAAWFHDVGYICGKEKHEESGCGVMRDKLSEWGMSNEDITVVESLIKATEMPQNPDSISAQILCDSDLYHLSSTKFKRRTESLRKELAAIHGVNFSHEDWCLRTLEFIDKHKYFTKYGTEVLEQQKEGNREWLKENCADYKSDEIKRLEEKLKKLKRGIPHRA
ncbi:HD domain-containing protein [Fulvivirga maritima]|uniref:HD domain-containing protein n=1 Tax=Fulvivirga maritima TaxID=2904247 RepID=UPI001F39B875|nr:HD domain-containing protein [Fulvivirga maritima]UII27853.1 HD domain-containing protein [Fulvivirga maritima]